MARGRFTTEVKVGGSARARTFTMYLDLACTQLADVQTPAGVTLAGSVVTPTNDGHVDFLGPDGVSTLYTKPATDASRVLQLTTTITPADGDVRVWDAARGEAKYVAPSTVVVPGAAGAYRSKGLTRRDFPGLSELPTVMASPPTATLSAAGASTAISGSVLISPSDTGAFTYRGASAIYAGSTYPAYDYLTGAGIYSSNTTASPFAVDFTLDSPDGLFEIAMAGKSGATGLGCRVLVDGKYATQGATFAPPSDGNLYLALVNLGAAGRYRISLEFDGANWFGGVRVLPSAGVQGRAVRPKRIWVVGDSFTEPTIIDTASTRFSGGDGWVQRLAYVLNADMRSCAKGGTGYLNPGTAVKAGDRIGTDLIPFLSDEDEVWWALGINDTATYSASAIATAAAACWAAVTAANPRVQQRVWGPFYPRGTETIAVSGMLTTDDALKAAAATAGLPFYDFLRMPAVLGQGSTAPVQPDSVTQNTISAFASNQVVSSVAYPIGTYLQIGSGASMEIRKVAGRSGSGPYTHTITGGNWNFSYAAGVPVHAVGPSYITGTGKQGTTNGTGTADRYTGSDGTHPTVAGHTNIAVVAYRLLAASLPA